jgi:hypothetical protein
MVYADATPTSIGVYWPGPPPRFLYREYEDSRTIAFAELAAALVALIHTAKSQHLPAAITLATDSSIVFYVLSTGKGYTLRQHVLLQVILYVV